MKFTVIYSENFMIGSHWNTIVKMKRIKVKSKSQLSNSLDHYYIDPASVNFIFEGWSALEGET